MWPIQIKSTRNHNNNPYNYNNPNPRTPSNPDFNHQSFKDIETLFPNVDLNAINEEQQQPSSSSSSCAPTCLNNRRSVFHRVHLANRFIRAFSTRPKPNPNPNPPEEEELLTDSSKKKEIEKSEKLDQPVKTEISIKSQPKIRIPGGADKRVVVYVTSLRVVRSTFEACRTVRSILQGFRVPIDERDLTMDASFNDEIRKIMAQIGQSEPRNARVELPRVFIGGRYIGGADEVVELHEIGELKKLVKGLPAATPGVCDFCGGFRFILCLECNGSHKCHIEDGGFRTCTECNENGLIRCPSCLST